MQVQGRAEIAAPGGAQECCHSLVAVGVGVRFGPRGPFRYDADMLRSAPEAATDLEAFRAAAEADSRSLAN